MFIIRGITILALNIPHYLLIELGSFSIAMRAAKINFSIYNTVVFTEI